MPIQALLFGAALIGVGLFGFVYTGSQHYTALIPAALGALLGVCGALALKDNLRKHAMHAAALIGLLGFLGGAAMVVPTLPDLLRDGKVIKVNKEGVERDATASVLSQAATCVLCALFVGLCVNSFIQARRARRATNAPMS